MEGSGLFRELKLALRQLFDVDVLEGYDPDVLHEPGRAVHVPHPGVVHGDLEEHFAVIGRPHLQVDIVGQVEPALSLHYVREQPDDVAVLAIELELHLGLVLLEIFRAHVLPSDEAGARARSNSTIGPSGPPAQTGVSSASSTNIPSASPSSASIPSARYGSASLLDTLTNERRWTLLGPCSSSAALRRGV